MRFIAAFLVLVSHVELTLALNGLPHKWSNCWEIRVKRQIMSLGIARGKLFNLFYALTHEMGAMAVVFFLFLVVF